MGLREAEEEEEPPSPEWENTGAVTPGVGFIIMFYCQNKGHICFLTKRDIYTLYKFTIAYKVFFLYTNVQVVFFYITFFIYIFIYINTFDITK